LINDEKLGGEEETAQTDGTSPRDRLNAKLRFLAGESHFPRFETSLARVYDVDADELAGPAVSLKMSARAERRARTHPRRIGRLSQH